MSIYSIYIILILFLAFIIYLYIKKQKINHLNTLIKDNKSEELRTLLHKNNTHFYISDYLIDLYTARSYAMDHDFIALKNQLKAMFDKRYQDNENLDYLTLYFHYFMTMEDIEFANIILNRIQKEKNSSFVKYCTWTFQVFVNPDTSLIKEMSDAIDQKEFHGFALGVVAYLIATQYENLNDLKNAALWYYTSSTVLQKNELYYTSALKKAEHYKAFLDKEI